MEILPEKIVRIEPNTPPDEAENIGFAPQFVAQCYMPYKEIEYTEKQRSIELRNGNASLNITPKVILPSDAAEIPNFVKVAKRFEDGSACFGFPYGVKPRLILNYIATYAKAYRTKEIPLGQHLTQFLSNLGLSLQGYHYQTIKDQLYRTCNCNFDWRYVDNKMIRIENQTFVKTYNFWWDEGEGTGNFGHPTVLGSSVTIDDEFYKYIIEKAIPISLDHIARLKSSPFAIDVYNWATLRSCSIEKSTFISWRALEMQFGQHKMNGDNDSTKYFAREFKSKLRMIKSYWSDLKVEEKIGAGQTPGGIIFHPSKPPVSKTKVQIDSRTKQVFLESGGSPEQFTRKTRNRAKLEDYQILKLESFYPSWAESRVFLEQHMAILGRGVFDETVATCAMLINEGRDTTKNVGTRLRDLFLRRIRENGASNKEEPGKKKKEPFPLFVDVDDIQATPIDVIAIETRTHPPIRAMDETKAHKIVLAMMWNNLPTDAREDYLKWYFDTGGVADRVLFSRYATDSADYKADPYFIDTLDRCGFENFLAKWADEDVETTVENEKT
jgi:hypothetical protein